MGNAANLGRGRMDNGTDIAFSRSENNNPINFFQYICTDAYERKTGSISRLPGLWGTEAEPVTVE